MFGESFGFKTRNKNFDSGRRHIFIVILFFDNAYGGGGWVGGVFCFGPNCFLKTGSKQQVSCHKEIHIKLQNNCPIIYYRYAEYKNNYDSQTYLFDNKAAATKAPATPCLPSKISVFRFHETP